MYFILEFRVMLFCCDVGFAVINVIFGVKFSTLNYIGVKFLTFGMSAE